MFVLSHNFLSVRSDKSCLTLEIKSQKNHSWSNSTPFKYILGIVVIRIVFWTGNIQNVVHTNQIINIYCAVHCTDQNRSKSNAGIIYFFVRNHRIFHIFIEFECLFEFKCLLKCKCQSVVVDRIVNFVSTMKMIDF